MRTTITAARAELPLDNLVYQPPSYGIDISFEYATLGDRWNLIRREFDVRMNEVVRPPWTCRVSSKLIESTMCVQYYVRALGIRMERQEFILPREIPPEWVLDRDAARYRSERREFSFERGDHQRVPRAGVADVKIVSKLDVSKDVSTEETDNQCDLCNDRARAVICLPCGHYKTCRTCITAVSKTSSAAQFPCPHCRTPVANVSVVFS